MSRDWNIYCKTCGDEHPFNDANHRVELMRNLIKHRSAIANLVNLLRDVEVDLTTSYGRIDPEWFATHENHDLVARSEYGDIDDGKTKW